MTDTTVSPLRQRMIDDMTIRKMAPKSPSGKFMFWPNVVA